MGIEFVKVVRVVRFVRWVEWRAVGDASPARSTFDLGYQTLIVHSAG